MHLIMNYHMRIFISAILAVQVRTVYFMWTWIKSTRRGKRLKHFNINESRYTYIHVCTH